MTNLNSSPQIASAFITGATGLLGNNLVRLLVVKALAWSREKAQKQPGELPVEIVVGEMTNVSSFAPHLEGIDTLFHTAAYFRDKGGKQSLAFVSAPWRKRCGTAFPGIRSTVGSVRWQKRVPIYAGREDSHAERRNGKC